MTAFRPLLLSLPVFCISCVSEPLPDNLDGIWISEGYGLAGVISGNRVHSYAVTNRTCIDEGTAPLRALLSEFSITPAADNQTFLLRAKGFSQAIRFQKQSQLPASCTEPMRDTPTSNFETFADIFATHYAFFDVYGVDWTARVNAARPLINDQMSDEALFAVMRDLIAPLKDGHITLKARINGQRLSFEPNEGRLFEYLKRQAQIAGQDPDEKIDSFRNTFRSEHVAKTILGGNGTTAGSDFVQYGLVSENVGYISLFTVAGYARGRPGFLEKDQQTIHAILDDAFAQFDAAGVKAVILDLSLNFGGYDDVALQIAGRIAEKATLAFTEYPGDAEDPLVLRRTVQPSERSRYTGPLYLLTSNMTVSAGEILTMALRSLPNTTHIGEPTRGALSDVLEKELPNGWTIELSNEVYVDNRGIKWEGRGIEPDVTMNVLSARSPLQSHQSSIGWVLDKYRHK